ncbi:unnamed protein product [Rhizoctonia solani]|uniref:AIG1-type G domain-containing protein n=1 Tax=Rhizoctonia solani TaxID=456999 RepID=A0A8H3H089_9AGAM|nr:unnamed protein product [Rhizoctonia solani]
MLDIGSSDSDSSTTPTGGTMKRPLSPRPPPSPEKSSHPATSREVESKATRQHPTRDNTVRVLILGRSGSGKTHASSILLQTLGHNSERSPAGVVCEATREPCSINVSIGSGEVELELIDTPGFDNMGMSDTEVFTKITDYLLEPDRAKTGITEIIYVHRAGDVIQSRSLSRIFQVLTDILLQGIGMPRLTVLEVHTGVHRISRTTLFDELQNRPSAFDQLWPLGAKIANNPDLHGLSNILYACVSQPPIILPIQVDYSRGSRSDLTSRIERSLGYYELGPVQELLRNRELLRNQENDLREKYEERLTRQRESESQLQQKLKEAELGYSSLRSQLQLQENIEQSEVVQALNDLNRMIDDIGRSISAHLTDTYVSSTFGRDPSDVTTKHSIDLPALKTLLDHVDGRSSIVLSSRGRGMQIENFFDFAIRHMLCRFLGKDIFRPFHPVIHTNLNRVLLTTYENIQQESKFIYSSPPTYTDGTLAPQVLAGKWRSETFNNIYKGDQSKREQHINIRLDRLMDDQLKPLVKCVFGQDIPFTEDDSGRLHRLIEMAWDWNSQLKGDIIMLVEANIIPLSGVLNEFKA